MTTRFFGSQSLMWEIGIWFPAVAFALVPDVGLGRTVVICRVKLVMRSHCPSFYLLSFKQVEIKTVISKGVNVKEKTRKE